VQTTPGIVRMAGDVGNFTWPGANGTNWWADPKEDLVAMFMGASPGPIRWHYGEVINAMVNRDRRLPLWTSSMLRSIPKDANTRKCDDMTKTLAWISTMFFIVLSDMGRAAEIKVLASGGFRAAYLSLLPEFERITGHKAVTTWGASIGATPSSIPNRLLRGESADVVILSRDSLGELTKQGKIIPESRVDLANSTIGVAVRTGTPKPRIDTVDSLMRAMLDAKSIAYSTSASGVYLERLFNRLGIASQLDVKRVSDEPVGAVVARGEARLGFQQISELLPVSGIDFVGPIPVKIQEVTVFSAGIPAGAKEQDGGRALIKFLSSPGSAPVIKKTGMDPR
jgi:molybdate transport system substrate-binding protein